MRKPIEFISAMSNLPVTVDLDDIVSFKSGIERHTFIKMDSGEVLRVCHTYQEVKDKINASAEHWREDRWSYSITVDNYEHLIPLSKVNELAIHKETGIVSIVPVDPKIKPFSTGMTLEQLKQSMIETSI